MKNLTKSILFLAMLTSWACSKQPVYETVYLSDWKFKTGDSLNWAKPEYNDAAWDTLAAGVIWESQGYQGYDGYAWYRKSFDLPNEMLSQAFFKDSLQIDLGKVDDTEETYLNGFLLGKNGALVQEGDTAKFETDPMGYAKRRLYIIPANDSRILWGKQNTIAVRVHDHGGGGGFYVPKMFVSLRDLKDYLVIDDVTSGLQIKDGKNAKTIFVHNKSGFATITGKIEVSIDDYNTGKNYLKTSMDVNLQTGATDSLSFAFADETDARMVATYTFTGSKEKNKFIQSQDFPYILTPKPAETPRINGARVFGVRPGSPFIFRIPSTGIRPMTFAVENLPEGLSLDPATGIITGKVSKAGEYKVVLKAKNAKGEAKRDFRIRVGDKLALTPPMGWNSWNVWGLAVDNDKVKAAADVFISNGLADHGYTYVNIDDGWEAPARAKNGEILTNEKFPDMKATADYVHSKGLRFGIYSSPGPRTCGGYLGSYQHELQDAQTYAKWGVDYLKYDWCSYSEVCPDPNNLDEQKKPYILMSQCLQKQDRDIVHSLCQYGMGDVWKWGGSVGGQLWRTTGDIEDTWESLKNIGFSQSVAAPYAKPGNWNDPDMLVVGWVGWGPKLHPTLLTASEQYTHISLWALLSAPMLMGCDLTRLDDFTLNLLTNDEVIDIDQDPLGKSAVPVIKTPLYEVWVKEMEDGSKVIGLFNLDKIEKKISIDWLKAGLSGKQTVRDVWRQKDIGSFDKSYEASVLPHGVMLIKVTKE